MFHESGVAPPQKSLFGFVSMIESDFLRVGDEL